MDPGADIIKVSQSRHTLAVIIPWQSNCSCYLRHKILRKTYVSLTSLRRAALPKLRGKSSGTLVENGRTSTM
jgi:hypothetical protein